jgi:peptidoglycan/xylan/chitin deacetylase (PgdA/CDA1 family)
MHCLRNRSSRGLFLTVLVLCLLIPGVNRAEEKAVPVLIYHQVLPAPNEPGETMISLERFREQMRFLHENGYTAIPVAELVAFMKGGQAPEKSVVLTFDDGWKSVKDVIPVLKEHRFKASLWIFPGTGMGYPHLDWPEVLEIAKDPDFEIGAHSMTHPWDGESLATWAQEKTRGRNHRRYVIRAERIEEDP